MNYQEQAASIVHDAKNRLQLLLPQVATLAKHEDEAVRFCASRITQDLDEVNQQLVLMLSLYRLEQTDLVVSEEIFVADLLDGVVERFQHRPIEVECRNELTVFSDPRLLQAVVGDALHNALRHSQGIITVSATKMDQGLLLKVTNNLAMNVEMASGSGVGLWIANKIAQSHCRQSKQGYARFELKPTQGVFELYLP